MCLKDLHIALSYTPLIEQYRDHHLNSAVLLITIDIINLDLSIVHYVIFNTSLRCSLSIKTSSPDRFSATAPAWLFPDTLYTKAENTRWATFFP
jgi:hypothetical protein